MTTPMTALWTPAATLADLEVRIRGGRVELVDRRLWLELLNLAPGETGALAYALAEKARRAGWVEPARAGQVS